jgi:hypothetical protein
MPIITKLENSTCRPAFICDHCQHEIKRAEDGNVYFSLDNELPVLFSHRTPECNQGVEDQFKVAGFDNLNTWLAFVVNNLKPDMDRAQANANLMSMD